ncbi:EARP-interacting [Nymphon striatum]|nr:EARP-interacting [Nymphon striatum]
MRASLAYEFSYVQGGTSASYIACDNKCETHGAIWKIPEVESSSPSDENISTSGHSSLELLCKLQTDGKDVKCINWNPCEDSSTIISVVDNKFQLWDLNESSTFAKLIGTCVLDVKGQPKFNSGRWNPHQKCSQFGTVNDTSIRGWDLRTMQQTYCIENAHCQLVRDIDFNPNKQYYLVSCGDDCYTKFWDIRNTSESLLSISNHSHWVWKVRYNHFHDQLILTSSSDSRVILSNIASLSSEPFGHLIDDENEDDESRKNVPEDGVISRYEEHEDSVYAVEWSVADPWIFASLSYDGRLVINRVPRSEKYKILL